MTHSYHFVDVFSTEDWDLEIVIPQQPVGPRSVDQYDCWGHAGRSRDVLRFGRLYVSDGHQLQ